MIHEMHYSATNTYLISGSRGYLLFDTGWAGTFPAFCRQLGDLEIPLQKISYVLISHFHPDHCGIAQEIADLGPVIAVMDVQGQYVHAADAILQRDPENAYHPIDDAKVLSIGLSDSRSFLEELGIAGEIIATPGHSDDSISLCLDDGSIFVGDLNPLYELELHQGTMIAKSWEKLLARHPRTVYYGHAKTAVLEQQSAEKASGKLPVSGDSREYDLIKRIMKLTDKGYSAERIQKKTGAPIAWIRDAMRMYLTHTDISVQGVLDRMEIRGR